MSHMYEIHRIMDFWMKCSEKKGIEDLGAQLN